MLMHFSGLWGHEYPQDPIFDRSRTGFVVNFTNFPLFLVSRLQIEIAISTIHSEYVTLSHSVRELLPLKIIIKEVIDNLGIDSENMKFVSFPLSMRKIMDPWFWQQFQG